MAAMCRTVRLADHNVRMHFRLIAFQSDIADQRENFYLFLKRYLFITFLLPIKISQRNIAEGANSGKMAGSKLIIFSKGRQSSYNLIALLEYKNISLHGVIVY